MKETIKVLLTILAWAVAFFMLYVTMTAMMLG